MTTLDTLYRRAFIRAVLSTVAFAVCMITLLITSAPANAQTKYFGPPPQLLQQWVTASTICDNQPTDPYGNRMPICDAADKVEKQLFEQGWVISANGVPVSRVQVDVFDSAVMTMQDRAKMAYKNGGEKAVISLMAKSMDGLLDVMSPEQLVAIWNDTGSDILGYAPIGAKMMRQIVATITSVKLNSTNVRYFTLTH